MQTDRVALALIDADQVIPKRGQHRLRDFALLESVRRTLEGRHETTASSFGERAAVDGSRRIGRLGLRYVLELLATQDSRSESHRVGADRGRIGGGDCARYDQDRHLRRPWPIEKFFVGVVVSADIVV